MKIVLDAWAILAYLQGEEPATTRVREVLQQAEARQVELFVSLINIGEVFYSVLRRYGSFGETFASSASLTRIRTAKPNWSSLPLMRDG